MKGLFEYVPWDHVFGKNLGVINFPRTFFDLWGVWVEGRRVFVTKYISSPEV